MTVGELIAFLADKPLDMEVMVNGYEMNYQAPSSIEVVDMWHVGSMPYCGDHDTQPPWNEEDKEEKTPSKQVVLIQR
jgi:hypothetical protein